MDLIKKTILVVVTLILIAVLGCLIIGVAIMRTNSTPSASNLPPAPSLFSASDTITLWMAVLSLMVTLSSLIVTGAGIIIGVLAVVGFQTFKTAVQQGASEAARDSAEEYFQGKAFNDKLVSSLNLGTGTVGTPQGGQPSNVLGKPYPKREHPK